MNTPITKEAIKRILTRELGITGSTDLLVFVNSATIGPIHGGEEAFLEGLYETAQTVIMPSFTYQTMITPRIGPPDNAIHYGSASRLNTRAEIFTPKLSVHPDCGMIPEVMRKQKGTLRSTHPVLSFIGRGYKAEVVLGAQTNQNPLGPIAALEAMRGKVMLVGVDHRHNFALHLAENRAGRRTFIRWALTVGDVEELGSIPGCMEGFNAIWGDVLGLAEVSRIGMARTEVYPLKKLLDYAEARIRQDHNFLLCGKKSCMSCQARKA